MMLPSYYLDNILAPELRDLLGNKGIICTTYTQLTVVIESPAQITILLLVLYLPLHLYEGMITPSEYILYIMNTQCFRP